MSERGISRKFGVVFFDDINDPQEGFSAVAGNDSSAVRISGVNELSTEVIWWTNISYESFYKRTEAWRSPWLRHDKYLVVSPRELLLEWGIDVNTVGADYAAKLCAEGFDRVMRIAFKLVTDLEPHARMEDIFQGKFLREDLRRLLPELEYPKGDAAAVIKSGNAWQEFTRTAVPGMRGGRWVMLRKPRMSYAHEMFNTPIPKGPFEFYGRADMRSVARDKNTWVIENDNPCIAEITINRLDGTIAPIYGFGNSTDKDKRVARSWVSHPELVVMNKFAEIDVKSVYMGDEYDLLSVNLPESVKDFLTDKFAEVSWSAGVIAETLWRAVALAEDKTQAEGGDRAHTSWQGAWLKGADKANMFLSAMQLTELGYSVMSYGLGWLRVASLDEDIPDLIRDALTLGLIPQIYDVTPVDENTPLLFHPSSPIPWGGDKQSMAIAQFTATASRELLWDLDKLLLTNRKKRKSAYVIMMQNHQKRIKSL